MMESQNPYNILEKKSSMNKGVGIGIAVAIAVVAIGGAFAFLGIQEEGTSDQSAELGVSDIAEVEVTSPPETEEEPQEESAKLGFKDVAEVEVKDPDEETGPQNVTISVSEKMVFRGETP